MSDVSSDPGPGLFASGGFGRSVAILSGGAAVGQLLLIAGTPILTRLFNPTEFGVFGIYAAFVATLSSVLSLRYETAIVTAESEADATQLAGLALRVMIPTSVLATLGLLQLIAWGELGFDDLPLYAALLALTAMVATGVTIVARYWLLREERFEIMAQIAVVQNAGRVTFQILLGLAGLSWVGLAVGDLLGRLLGTLRAGIPALGRALGQPLFDRVRARKLAGDHRDLATFLAPSTVINSLANLVAVPLVAHFYGVIAAGQFFLVTRVLALPATLIGSAVADSFHGRIARDQRSNQGGIRRRFHRTALALLAVGVVPTVVLMLAGETLFTTVFGSKWASAGMLASVLAPRFLAAFVVSPVSRIVLVVGGQRSKLVYDVLALAGVVGALVYADAAGLDLVGAGVALSVLGVLAYAIYYLVLTRIARRAPNPESATS